MKPDREAVRSALVDGLFVDPETVEEFMRDCELSHMAFWTFPPDEEPAPEAKPNPLDGTRLWPDSQKENA